jgi:hypothetical protein
MFDHYKCVTMDNHGLPCLWIFFLLQYFDDCNLWHVIWIQVDSQMLMWKMFIRIMREHGVLNVSFKGFMAKYTQTNFNAMKILFRNGDLKISWRIKNVHLFNIGLNLLINVQKSWYILNFMTNTSKFVMAKRMPQH